MLAHGLLGEHLLAAAFGLVGTVAGLHAILANRRRAVMVTPVVALACAAGIVACDISLADVFGYRHFDGFNGEFSCIAFPVAILGIAGLIMAVGKRYAPRDPTGTGPP